MASLVPRSAGLALRRSVLQGSSLRSPVSGFAVRPSPRKYSTSSSGLQALDALDVQCQHLDAKVDELTNVIGGLEKAAKELELVLEKKDAIARRYARQRPLKMVAGATLSFALGFYTNQYVPLESEGG